MLRKGTDAGHIERRTRITTGHDEVPKTATIVHHTESTTKIMIDHAEVRTAATLADHIESMRRTMTGHVKARRVATIAAQIESMAKTIKDHAKARKVTTVADHIESTAIEITTRKGPKTALTVIYIESMVKLTINHNVAHRTGTDPFATWIIPVKKLKPAIAPLTEMRDSRMCTCYQKSDCLEMSRAEVSSQTNMMLFLA